MVGGDAGLGGLVLVEQLLDADLLVAAGTDERLRGVGEIILIERQLSLGDPDELADAVFRRGRGQGQRSLELGDAVLVRGDRGLSGLNLRGEFLGFGSDGGRIFGRIAHRCGEGQVHGMVGEPQRFLRVLLLRAGHRQGGELLGGIERAGVHRSPRSERRGAELVQALAIIRQVAGQHGGAQNQEQQGDQAAKNLFFAVGHGPRLGAFIVIRRGACKESGLAGGDSSRCERSRQVTGRTAGGSPP